MMKIKFFDMGWTSGEIAFGKLISDNLALSSRTCNGNYLVGPECVEVAAPAEPGLRMRLICYQKGAPTERRSTYTNQHRGRPNCSMGASCS